MTRAPKTRPIFVSPSFSPLHSLVFSVHFPFYSSFFLSISPLSPPPLFHSLFSPRFHDDSAVGKIFVDAGTPSPIRPNFTNIRGRINASSLNDDVSARPPLPPFVARCVHFTYKTKRYTVTTHVPFTFARMLHFISISVIFDGRAIHID